MRKSIILLILLSLSFSQYPYTVNLYSNSDYRQIEDGLSSNGIYDLEILNDSTIFIGSGNGLNLGYYDNQGNIIFSHFTDENLPEDGNPALTIKGDVIAVSSVKVVETAIGSQSQGTGISYSIDGGESWSFIPQPIDKSHQSDPSYINKWACPWDTFDSSSLYDDDFDCDMACMDCSGNSSSCMMYDYISWGVQDSILNFSVTTDIQNVSYGLAISGDYIYAASWAGSLRRFEYTSESPEWEVVPLPMDNQEYLECSVIDQSIYQINPVGNYVDNYNCGYEFDNHKVFSVYSIEDTLWVGTADGINRGIVDSESCIDWEHFTSEESGFYDDWVIGFEHQLLEDGITNRIWAITWDREYAGSHLIYGGPPSYTDNGGQSWAIADDLDSKNLLTYNISSSSEKVYVSSDQGLFFTTNYSSVNLWDEFILPNEISTESVFDAEHLEFFDDIFIGTSQGICVYDGDSFSCESSSSDASESFYAYPNPLNFNETNQLTFVYNDDEININGKIVIFDIAMDRVAKINGVGISRWDGNNEFGDRVANGLYICKYTHNNGDSHLFNIIVVN